MTEKKCVEETRLLLERMQPFLDAALSGISHVKYRRDTPPDLNDETFIDAIESNLIALNCSLNALNGFLEHEGVDK